MDITKEEKDTAVLTNRVNNVETNIADIKADLRGIRNAIMVVSLAAVGAMAVLFNQMHSLTLEVREVSFKQELLRRDIKEEFKELESRLNVKLDTIVDSVNKKDNN